MCTQLLGKHFVSVCVEEDFSYDAERFSNCVQQKILIRVTMTDDKTRAKAMKTATQFKGNNDT